MACVGDAPFAYVNVFRAHANVGLFCGAELVDPARLLEGSGKRMRHVKVKPNADLNYGALAALIADLLVFSGLGVALLATLWFSR